MEENYITDNNLPQLEPLMPGEDAPLPLTQERNYSDAIRETENILAEAEALNVQKEMHKDEMKKQARTLLLIIIALYLYAHLFLVHWAAFLAMLLPAAIAMGTRIFKKHMSFKDAAKDCTVCLLLTALFCIISL
ncbi:MAG TPA: hypothetical protein PLH98_07750 [Ruminococcus flavefaciens]|nr:hypothetical protein [Ruminococcus flavefaciens]